MRLRITVHDAGAMKRLLSEGFSFECMTFFVNGTGAAYTMLK